MVLITVVADAVSLHVAVMITALIPHQDKKERYILASKQVGQGVQLIIKTCPALLMCTFDDDCDDGHSDNVIMSKTLNVSMPIHVIAYFMCQHHFWCTLV